jgi:hypothetical protein
MPDRASKRGYAAVIVGALGAVGASVALAGGGSSGGPTKINVQQVASTHDAVVATPEKFRTIGELSLDLCRPAQGLSLTVSLDFEGGPALVRVAVGRTGQAPKVLQPGEVSFAPDGAASFTFVDEKRSGLDSRYYVQWRADGGENAVLDRGTSRALFQTKGETAICAT